VLELQALHGFSAQAGGQQRREDMALLAFVMRRRGDIENSA